MAKTLNITGKRKVFYIISATIVALTVIFSFVFGVELDITFKGGTIITYSYDGEIDNNAVASLVEQTVNRRVNVSQGENLSGGGKNIKISFVSEEGLTADLQSELSDALQTSFAENNLQLISSDDVNPSTGRDFFGKCIVAVVVSAVLMILYIAVRFKKISGWSAGVMAVIALLHDVLVVYAVFVFARIPLDANFMAVVLTILGYSINNTIVIYDRIRENQGLMPKKTPVEELVNTSINQTLARSINTSISTIVAMIVVSVVAMMTGVTSILSFSFPLIIGLISGTYSSMCIAPSLWVTWQTRKKSDNK